MSYQRQRASAPLSALPNTVVGSDADAAAAASVRHFTKACDTDIANDGTTAPQGVKCIDATYRAAGYTPHISVLGNDSQWAAFGMFPEGTGIEERSVELADLRTALDADHSVILLVGFYRMSSDGKRWDRIKGHYISVTGYGYDRAEGSDDMTLLVVDPSIDYGKGKPFNAVTMRQREAAGVQTGLPENASYDLTGESISFGAIRTVVETAIVFDATRGS
jgi:hypothetical protein